MSEDNMQHPEVPVIIIERDDEPKASFWHNTVALSVAAIGILGVLSMAVLASLYIGYKVYNEDHIGVPISVTPAQNIEKLKGHLQKETAEVVLTRDTILDVPLDFYALHGLQAGIQFEEPDAADTTVYLYSRCADYTPDGKYLGSLVAEGQEMQNDCSRLGYMAMADGRMVIGISRSDEVKDYVIERRGSFFRQFILLSDGVMPLRYYLHGKVERRSIGRKDNQLYLIATCHKETLWDFADALREYGFIDAIYITGGNDYCFYRTRDGMAHDIGTQNIIQRESMRGIIPWLVFRKME